MKLADKIIKLRKQFGWSQEELAEKLKVSRQSVSKWEGALSIPDLNKIIKLGEIFGVSTDYLLKDEIEEAGIDVDGQDEKHAFVTLKEANTYLANTLAKSKVVVRAVFLFIGAVIPLLLGLAFKSGGVLEVSDAFIISVGLVAMFIMVVLGVVVIISTTQKYKINESIESAYFELEYGAESIFKEKLESFSHTYMRNVSIGVTLFIVSSLPLIVAATLNVSRMTILLMLVLLLVLVDLGLYLLIPTATVNEAYKKLLHQGQYAYDKIEENKRIMGFATFYWTLVLALYLGWSLWTMAWAITWIVWPVAGLLFVALFGLINFVKMKK